MGHRSIYLLQSFLPNMHFCVKASLIRGGEVNPEKMKSKFSHQSCVDSGTRDLFGERESGELASAIFSVVSLGQAPIQEARLFSLFKWW